jgi:hypothetical protein
MVFRKLDLFPSSGEGEKTPIQLGPLERANLNQSRFRNVVFSSLLEYRTMEKSKKPSKPVCYTPSSEPFRIYLEEKRFVQGVCYFINKIHKFI